MVLDKQTYGEVRGQTTNPAIGVHSVKKMMKMKNTLITLGLLITSATGFCDTLDYWHVYLNDSLIAQFNLASQQVEVEIDRSKIIEDDLLTVKYVADTPCVYCKCFLFVRDEKNRKLQITQTNEIEDKISIRLLELIEIGDKNNSKRYDFYYWKEAEGLEDKPMTLVIRLQVT